MTTDHHRCRQPTKLHNDACVSERVMLIQPRNNEIFKSFDRVLHVACDGNYYSTHSSLLSSTFAVVAALVVVNDLHKKYTTATEMLCRLNNCNKIE